MNESSQWICKLSALNEISRLERLDLLNAVSELDPIALEKGVEYHEIQYDLQNLLNCY
jgi:hypothetical protein